MPSPSQWKATGGLHHNAYTPGAKLVPIVEQPMAAAAAPDIGSIYAREIYQPRPDDSDEMEIWVRLNAVFAMARITHLRDYVTMVDAELADRRPQENHHFIGIFR